MKMIFSIFICTIQALSSHEQDSSFKPVFSSVMDTSLGRKMLYQCSRSAPGNVKGFWRPSNEDVKNLEDNFTKILQLAGTGCCNSGPGIEHLEKFGFQYLGVVIKGRKYIYINAFPISEVQEFEKTGGDPLREPMIVCDGGPAFWGALFEVESKKFSALAFNGVG